MDDIVDELIELVQILGAYSGLTSRPFDTANPSVVNPAVAITVPAIWLMAYATEYWHFLVIGLFVGLAGGSFSVGTPYVARWFPKQRQGFAMGVFGAGNSGAAVNKFVAPVILVAIGWTFVPQVYAVAMLVMTIGMVGLMTLMALTELGLDEPLLDRIGVRRGFGIAITVWSLAAMHHLGDRLGPEFGGRVGGSEAVAAWSERLSQAQREARPLTAWVDPAAPHRAFVRRGGGPDRRVARSRDDRGGAGAESGCSRAARCPRHRGSRTRRSKVPVQAGRRGWPGPCADTGNRGD